MFLVDREGVVGYVGGGGKDGWYPEVEGELLAAVARGLAEK